MQKGDYVQKIKGYTFRGYVLGTFEKLDGEERIVVEMENSGGLLHIFSPHQLEVVEDNQ